MWSRADDSGRAGGYPVDLCRGRAPPVPEGVGGADGGILAGLRESAQDAGGAAHVIALTDKAASKVSELITAEGDQSLALRVAVRPGGCSGFSYDMFFDTEITDDDLWVVKDGVRVVVDRSSAMLLEGATLDYADGLTQAGFSINNPNAQRTCGCGQSFS